MSEVNMHTAPLYLLVCEFQKQKWRSAAISDQLQGKAFTCYKTRCWLYQTRQVRPLLDCGRMQSSRHRYIDPHQCFRHGVYWVQHLDCGRDRAVRVRPLSSNQHRRLLVRCHWRRIETWRHRRQLFCNDLDQYEHEAGQHLATQDGATMWFI